MTSFEILRAPMIAVPPRRATVNCRTACTCGTLPMLCEDDLVGSNINIDHYVDVTEIDAILNQ